MPSLTEMSRIREAGTKAANLLRGIAVKPIVRIYLHGIEGNILKTMEPEFAKGFIDKFLEEMTDESTTPILVSSHQGHGDAAQAAVLSKQLTSLANKARESFQGFVLIVAASIRTGHQGQFLREALLQAEGNYAHRYNLRFLDLVRKKDEDLSLIHI